MDKLYLVLEGVFSNVNPFSQYLMQMMSRDRKRIEMMTESFQRFKLIVIRVHSGETFSKNLRTVQSSKQEHTILAEMKGWLSLSNKAILSWIWSAMEVV